MISLVSTVRAPRGDLERFVAYHLKTGVNHIDLFFDDPDDPAMDAFAGSDRVSVIACTPEHWQAPGITPDQGIEARQLHNAALAMARARQRGDQWLLHVDSDELIFTPENNLAAWLGARVAEVDVVLFPVLEAIPRPSRRRHPFEACCMFKTTPDPARIALAARFGCRQALRYGYFRGYRLGKSATRVTVEVDSVGIHLPTRQSSPLRVETAKGAYVLHYDCCTFDAWKQKWMRRTDRSGLVPNMRPDRQRQFDDFLIAAESGSPTTLEREYRRQCLIPVHEQMVLWALGVARPIRLSPGLFA